MLQWLGSLSSSRQNFMISSALLLVSSNVMAQASGTVGGIFAPGPKKPFGSNEDFIGFLLAIALFSLAVQLFLTARGIQRWAFWEDSETDFPLGSGTILCIVSVTLIFAASLVRAKNHAQSDDPWRVIACAPGDLAIGLLAASLIPSGLAATQLIGTYAALRSLPTEVRGNRSLGMTLGAALLGLINLGASIATLVVFFHFPTPWSD